MFIVLKRVFEARSDDGLDMLIYILQVVSSDGLRR